MGSPPQVRGKPAVPTTINVPHRITPAGAGKTTGVHPELFAVKDHPRRCGENKYPHCVLVSNMGSPPQVRGKHDKIIGDIEDFRITPAGAGKTLSLSERLRRRQDHPRRCGENPTVKMFGSWMPGSPPQVRGKQKEDYERPSVTRITPAGAGKT